MIVEGAGFPRCERENILDVRLVDHLCAARMFLLGQADVHVDTTKRFGDLGPQVLAHGAAGDPANHLAEDEPERCEVIALRSPGLPPGLGFRQSLTYVVPIQRLLRREALTGPDHA